MSRTAFIKSRIFPKAPAFDAYKAELVQLSKKSDAVARQVSAIEHTQATSGAVNTGFWVLVALGVANLIVTVLCR